METVILYVLSQCEYSRASWWDGKTAENETCSQKMSKVAQQLVDSNSNSKQCTYHLFQGLFF